MQLSKIILSAFGLAVATACPALATETVSCLGTDDPQVVVEMNLGQGLPADRPNWVRVVTPHGMWSMLESDKATPVSLYQSFDDGRSLSIDLADENVDSIAISIRILTAKEGDQVLRVGYLHVLGDSLHPIVCDFGDSK
jgi:hypothetical protein